jgi:N-acyl homoserine lactone hydrolase
MLRDVRFLNMGSCLIDRSQLVTGHPVGDVVRIPIWAYLLRGDEGTWLVDTGMPMGCIGNERYFGEMEPGDLILPQMTDEDMIDRVLVRAGLRLRDIGEVIFTHAHFDHAGGSALFQDARVLAHPDEVAALRQDPELPEWIDLGLRYEAVQDGFEPMPGVRLIHTPGHTPGHLSLLLRPQGGRTILLTVDAVYTRRNWDEDILGAMTDRARGQASVERLRAVAAAEDAAVFFGHDPDQATEAFWCSFIG